MNKTSPAQYPTGHVIAPPLAAPPQAATTVVPPARRAGVAHQAT